MSLSENVQYYKHRLKFKTKMSVGRPFPHLNPAAIIIGAQKGGTTALYEYLSQHPRVSPSVIKEIDFFGCNSRYARGIGYYHAHFPIKTPWNRNQLTLDVTPGYLGGAARAAQRIYDYDKNIKLIAVLRNPVTRAHSAWQMYRKEQERDPEWFYIWARRCDKSATRDSYAQRTARFGDDFAQDIQEEIDAIKSGEMIEMPILALGMYYNLLRHYYDLFPRENIMVLCNEEMREDTVGHLREIDKFVGLPPHTWTPAATKPRFTGGYKETISANASDLLTSFYAEPNRDLESLLQRTFPW